ncbi:MAG: tRNA lysidine(34) synthetase TilS [Flavobacteriales bacterium]|nr:MAG: tRNA lysidine(34) synthetase TilS [Flavobacteriales bacterium]
MRSQLLDEVRRFIRRERMLEPGEPLHVAVSGGIDSMVLLHALKCMGHPCSVLHVDHGLRGAESEGDRAFVEEHCRREGIPFRWKRVDAAAHAKEKGLSIQMAARELRYAFFAEAWKDQPWRTVLAHHADDAVETLLMHLMRGVGVFGWSTIPPVSGVFVRPLLAVDRATIEAYATEHAIPFREDSSNTDAKYLRNRVRHELLPLMEAMRPGARRSMARSTGLLRELVRAGELVRSAEPLSLTPERELRIPFTAVENSPTPTLLLHQLLRHLGFHPDMLDRVRDAILERRTGAEFIAGGWRAIVDRESLIVARIPADRPAFIIDLHQPVGASAGFRWVLTEGEPFKMPASMDEAVLDADRLDFPVEVRPWRPGDRMRPTGLGGRKLISDILIDAKVPRNLKDLAYVLVSGGEVAWLAGHRIGEGFQATEHSLRVLRIQRG